MKNGMLALSVAFIILGLMLLIMPETSLLWICYAFGIVVLMTGAVCLFQYAKLRGTGFTAPFMLVGGVITVGLGIFTLLKPEVVASFLPIVFGLFILVDGCSRIGSAIDLAKRKGQKWWVLLLLSLLSIALGVLLLANPFDAMVSVVMPSTWAAPCTPPWSCAHWNAWRPPPPTRHFRPWPMPPMRTTQPLTTTVWYMMPKAPM